MIVWTSEESSILSILLNLANTDSKRAELSACIIIIDWGACTKKQRFYEFLFLWDLRLIKLSVCLFVVCMHDCLFVSKFACFLLVLLSLINFFRVATKNM